MAAPAALHRLGFLAALYVALGVAVLHTQALGSWVAAPTLKRLLLCIGRSKSNDNSSRSTGASTVLRAGVAPSFAQVSAP
jgi:hypothetical protein